MADTRPVLGGDAISFAGPDNVGYEDCRTISNCCSRRDGVRHCHPRQRIHRPLASACCEIPPGLAAPDHTVPYGTVPSHARFPRHCVPGRLRSVCPYGTLTGLWGPRSKPLFLSGLIHPRPIVAARICRKVSAPDPQNLADLVRRSQRKCRFEQRYRAFEVLGKVFL